MLTADAVIDLLIEKPAAGGRMIARHEGQVVFVSGAIPGERVRARVEKVGKGLAHAVTVEILDPSPDRRETPGDPGCGGHVLAHVAYARQLGLKAEIIADAFARIGHLPLAKPVPVTGSPEQGYRMRARLHVRGGRIGFFREGTHDLCEAGQTAQLLPTTVEWIAILAAALRARQITAVAEFDLAENVDASERACHLLLTGEAPVERLAALADVGGLTGLSAERPGVPGLLGLFGAPWVHDRLQVGAESRASNAESPDPSALRLAALAQGGPTATSRAEIVFRRDVRAFFQGNRYLLPVLIDRVIDRVKTEQVVDLYAGGGLFGLSLAALGRSVTLVEGDRVSGADLLVNAEPFGGRAKVKTASVEQYLGAHRLPRAATVVLDPPRTGLSRAALTAILAQTPPAIIYVSCDVATVARDCRAAVEAGYEVQDIEALDLFPNTAHVETILTLTRGAAL